MKDLREGRAGLKRMDGRSDGEVVAGIVVAREERVDS